MDAQIQLGDMTVDVVLKDIKNVHLSVYPPTGRVRIAAPLRMSLDRIRLFAISKLDWIKQQQKKLKKQQRESPREYLDRESHYVWGKRYLLKLVEKSAAPKVELKHSHLLLQMRPGTSAQKKQAILDQWYREQLRKVIPPLIEKWQTALGVQISDCGIKKMKTKWGTCNVAARRIWVNLELAKKPAESLEYIIAHEITHLLERHHNDRFAALMDKNLPHWRNCRQELNAAPLTHENWSY